MSLIRTLSISGMMVAFAMLAEEPFVPRFADIPSVEAARKHLNAVGVETFVAEAQKGNVSPPHIHSRYWVDTMPAEAARERKLEEAYRDFGLELARQLGDKAISFFDNPDRASETNRFAWLLAVDEWILGSCGYANYRISRRLEGIAGVILARIITDFSVPNDVIEKFFSMFPTEERKAMWRADILFEESRGAMDVREAARLFSNKGDFESQWTEHLRAALRHFDSTDKLCNYRQFRDRINSEEPEYSFFCEDERLPHVRTVVNTWDYKEHYTTCVHGGGFINLNPLRSLYLFRKVLGKFPNLPDSGDAYRDYHATYWVFSEAWMPYERQYGKGGGGGHVYYQTIHNELMDFETAEIVSNRGKGTEPRPQPPIKDSP